jgi:hypothetical protein
MIYNRSNKRIVWVKLLQPTISFLVLTKEDKLRHLEQEKKQKTIYTTKSLILAQDER